VPDQASKHSNKLFSASQIRELDRTAIEQHGISGIELMTNAGRHAWELLDHSWPDTNRIVVVCGGGNNAGDGYVLAKYAIEHGKNVDVIALVDPAKLKGDAKTAADTFIKTGEKPVLFSEQVLSSADVIVDALLGTGLDRDLANEFLLAINTINKTEKPVLSIDIPSGLNADTGRPMGVAINAKHTCTFIGLKKGLFTGLGPDYCGKVHFFDLDVPQETYDVTSASAQLIRFDALKGLLTTRKSSAHKGNFGHVLIVGGDYGYAGAVCMSAEAAARCGAGLVSVATRPEHAFNIPLSRPEIMAVGVTEPADMNPLLKRATVVAIGPGLGQSEWSMSVLSHVLDTGLPLIVDADALNLLSQDSATRDNWVLTPHPGEAARLLDCTTREIEADRFASATEIQKKYGGINVLKGRGTIISDTNGQCFVSAEGNPGMATGGMGDILTGVIAGLYAQLNDLDAAAKLGVCLHAVSADRAVEQGERGMLAMDVIPWLRHYVNS